MRALRLVGRESSESGASSMEAPPLSLDFSDDFFSFLSPFFFFDFFLGRSHSHRGINDSTYGIMLQFVRYTRGNKK
jgi:hypothetical protein